MDQLGPSNILKLLVDIYQGFNLDGIMYRYHFTILKDTSSEDESLLQTFSDNIAWLFKTQL